MRRELFPATVLLLTLIGCKSDAGKKGRSDEPGKEAAQYDSAPDPANTGSVSGTVRFDGVAPQRVPIDMSQDPACSLANSPNLSEQVVVAKGKLANVFVYVNGAPHLPPPTEPTLIDQHGCRFQPHMVAIEAGGSVEFRNSDPTMHNVHSMAVQTGNRNVDVSQGPGARPERLVFQSAENMISVRCNNHPWMNAFINVAPNSFYAVSGNDGSFSIRGLPMGTYDLVTVHEKLGEQHTSITVKPQAVTSATVTYYASH